MRKALGAHRLLHFRGLSPLIGDVMPLANMLATVLVPQSDWAPVIVLVLVGLAFGIGTIVASIVLGPRRTGATKEAIYESGMVPIGTTKRRFNARFYIVAMIFLVFDVEIVFFYPWATVFPSAGGAIKGLLLAEMVVFILILAVAYIYAWGKGVFRWD